MATMTEERRATAGDVHHPQTLATQMYADMAQDMDEMIGEPLAGMTETETQVGRGEVSIVTASNDHHATATVTTEEIQTDVAKAPAVRGVQRDTDDHDQSQGLHRQMLKLRRSSQTTKTRVCSLRLRIR